MRRTYPFCAFFAITALFVPQCLGTIWWDNGGTDDRWGTRQNWSVTSGSGGGDPSSAQIDNNNVVFNQSNINSAQTIRLATSSGVANQLPNSVTFQSSGSVEIIRGVAGSKLRIGGGGINVTGTGTYTLNVPIDLRASQTWLTQVDRSLTQTLRNVDLLSGRRLTIDGGGTTTITGSIIGTGNLRKIGNGTLSISGTNTYTGGTIIDDGVVQISSAANLPGSITMGRGQLNLTANGINLANSFTMSPVASGNAVRTQSGHTGTLSGTISGSGAFRKVGPGTLAITNSNTYSGGTYVDEGTVSVGAGANLGSGIIIMNGGTLATGGSTFGQPVRMDANSVINVPTASAIFTSQISGAGSLTKTGAGVLRLNGNNVHSGGVVVSQGELHAEPESLGTGNVTLLNGTRIELLGSSGSWSNTLNLGGTVNMESIAGAQSIGSTSGSGTLRYDGIAAEAATLRVSGALNHTGGTDLIEGGVKGTSDALRGDFTSTVTSSWAIFEQPIGFSGSYAGRFDGTGAFIKQGAGTLSLTGEAVNSRGIFLRGGPLNVTASATLGTGPFTFDVLREATSNVLRFQSSRSLNNGLVFSGSNVTTTIDTEHHDVTVAGDISGSGTFVKTGSGKLTLSGASSTYTGPLTVGEGTLVSNTALGSVVVNPDARLGGSFNASSDLTVSGTLAPGNSPGIITVNGDLTLNSSSTLEIEAGAPSGIGRTFSPGVDHDQVIVSGTTTLGGAIEFPLLPGFSDPMVGDRPMVGDTITFLQSGGFAGSLDDVSWEVPGLQAAAPGIASVVRISGSNLELEFVQASNDLFFDETVIATPNWHNPDTWDDGNGNPTVPQSADVVSVSNLTGANTSQWVEVSMAVAATDELTLSEDQANRSIGINVTESRELFAASGDITIGRNAEISLGDASGKTGSLRTPTGVSIENGGTLSGNGFVEAPVSISEGTIALSATDVLSIRDPLTLDTSDAVYQVEVAADGPDGDQLPDSGLLEIESGSSLKAGTLSVLLADGFVPELGDLIKIASVSSAMETMAPPIDEFEMETVPILPSGNVITVNYNPFFDQGSIYLFVATVDFDSDGDTDIDDIDDLVAAITAGSTDLLFDMNGDGLIDQGDLSAYLDVNGIMAGDANLDGVVDGQDFLTWNSSKFTTHLESAWSLGDFNADGSTDGSDFVLWNQNKFQSADQLLVVPEPVSSQMAHLLLMLSYAQLRRSRRY